MLSFVGSITSRQGMLKLCGIYYEQPRNVELCGIYYEQTRNVEALWDLL